MTKYRLTITATCPVDGTTDVYEVTLKTNDMLKVEAILDAVKHYTGKPIFQERLTFVLAMALQSEVTTKGTHSGVKTTCTEFGGKE